jgi:3-methyladenine DNA glycosylase AlkD
LARSATDISVANVNDVLAELRVLGSEKNRAGMARYGINNERAYGVSMEAARPLARKYRRQHMFGCRTLGKRRP